MIEILFTPEAWYTHGNRTPYRNKAVLHDEDTRSKVWKFLGRN